MWAFCVHTVFIEPNDGTTMLFKQHGRHWYRRIRTPNFVLALTQVTLNVTKNKNQRTNGPENAHLKPDPGVLSHHEMTLTLNTHTPLLNS